MFVLAESGATKGDWRLLDGNCRVARVLTPGTNVSTMDAGTIRDIIRDAASRLIPEGTRVDAVYFYTAGVLTPELTATLEEDVRRIFSVEEVEVQTDLVAAARAACGHSAGIAAIMGTGSNSCQWDGEKIVRHIKSGGFILGDDGSASVIGKLFISDYIKGLVPEPVVSEFKARFPGLDYAAVVEEVYHSKGSPSAWLGAFCPFILSRYDHPYIKKLVDGSLQAFIDRSLRQYDIDRYPVGVIGGFGQALKDIFTPFCEAAGIRIRAFIPAPIDELEKYHTHQI